jgi:hypothetical protein
MFWSSHDPAPIRRAGFRLAKCICVSAPFWCEPTYSPATAASVQFALDAEAGVTAASNPLLLRGSHLSALLFEASLKPGIKIVGDTGSSLDLGGTLNPRAYSQRYGEFLLGEAHATGLLRQSEKLVLTTTTAFNRDISADILTEGVDASIDPRSLRNSLNARAALAWTPNARDTITPRISFDLASFERTTALEKTRAAVADIGVARRLNERTALGIRSAATFSRVGAGTDFSTLALFFTVDQRLGARLRLNAEAGIERSRDLQTGQTSNQFGGRSQLCTVAERTNACIDATVASQISAAGGLQRRLTAGAALTHQIGPRQTLGLSAEYQRAKRITDPPSPTLSAASVRATLDWALNRVLTLGGRVEYRHRDVGSGSGINSGFVGIQLRWQRR